MHVPHLPQMRSLRLPDIAVPVSGPATFADSATAGALPAVQAARFCVSAWILQNPAGGKAAAQTASGGQQFFGKAVRAARSVRFAPSIETSAAASG